MNKSKILLLSITFLFLFSGSVFGEEPEVKRTCWNNGKLKIEIPYKNGKPEGRGTSWYESGEKMRETSWKNGKQDGLSYRLIFNGDNIDPALGEYNGGKNQRDKNDYCEPFHYQPLQILG
jgi:antitoxin component YwqK of YwqJK toxin-antitoxin module